MRCVFVFLLFAFVGFCLRAVASFFVRCEFVVLDVGLRVVLMLLLFCVSLFCCVFVACLCLAYLCFVFDCCMCTYCSSWLNAC